MAAIVQFEYPWVRDSFVPYITFDTNESDFLSPSKLLPPGEQLEHAHGPNLFRANSYDPKRFNLKDREADEYDDQVNEDVYNIMG